MYKSQFQKLDPYDWFCGPGSHFRKEHLKDEKVEMERVMNNLLLLSEKYVIM